MINHLSISLLSNELIYEKRDYRRWMLSHMQYLRGLCQISIESVKNSVEQFRSTLFVSKELLFENDFNEHINTIIEQTKQNTPYNLNRIFSLIENINFGNSIVSRYETNYKYKGNYTYEFDSTIRNPNFVSAISETYDNDCLCALHMNCTSQAYFIGINSSTKIRIKDLKIGCIPTESFLLSTLECFYDVSCVNRIKEHTNYSYSLTPLSNQSQMINLTVNELVQNLFTDQWIITKNYSSYYELCLPFICSYTYIEKVSLIYIVSFLLGLQGGLTIILK